ncbi:MAG: hypothetical protein RSE17_01260 [Bacilli bacterium]
MINLYEYYSKNIIDESYYHYTFNVEIETYFAFNDDLKYFDEEELKTRFKELTYPVNKYIETKCIEFIMICFYLNNNGYYIDLFPNFLERPTSVDGFSISIREYIRAQDCTYSGTVTCAGRRGLANSLKFLKKENSLITVSEDLNNVFKKISNRNTEYVNMNSNEKLSEINNVIENILKVNNKWETIDYKTKTFDFLSDTTITKYRNITNCFRHGSGNSIEEKNSFTEEQKKFLINYGTTICEVIYDSINSKINANN